MFTFQDCDGVTWSDMQATLCKKFAELYKRHKYVYDKLSEYEKKNFDKIHSGILQYAITRDSLVDLSKYLKNYHKSKCIILIDEYNHPLDIAYRYQYYEEARGFFSSLFGALLKVSIYL